MSDANAWGTQVPLPHLRLGHPPGDSGRAGSEVGSGARTAEESPPAGLVKERERRRCATRNPLQWQQDLCPDIQRNIFRGRTTESVAQGRGNGTCKRPYAARFVVPARAHRFGGYGALGLAPHIRTKRTNPVLKFCNYLLCGLSSAW